jgi:hypothetical protein
MVDSNTLLIINIAHIPPDYVKQVANMVKALLNKYIPIPSIDEVKINLI